MADQQEHYDFAAVEAQEILADRQRGWQWFTQMLIWGVVAVATVLVLLAVFVV
ncbi:MAG TPA: preprotein translocase subunit SecE [Crenalkalicoccus sp.]|jgi:hypothetical protein|nr:preprotein translocase subunit SecE [Crenalkalicoccus sp.]